MKSKEFFQTIENSKTIEMILKRQGKPGRVSETVTGPTVTTHYFTPGYAVRLKQVSEAKEDLARALGVNAVRVTKAPGKPEILIEVPRAKPEIVRLETVLADSQFKDFAGSLPLVLGKDTQDNLNIIDLASAPHLLIAGTTGSGKSILMNCLILSLLEHKSADQLQFIMIDPKIVELSIYDGIPHLIGDVLTTTRKAAEGLSYAVSEMERRYELFKQNQIRNIAGYHLTGNKLPYLVVVIDEFAELIQASDKKLATACAGMIQRLAQAGRAAGIHVIAATQRPTVDVISGTIKSNFPSRISLSMTSLINSRTILDEGGAENLIGKGDLLYLSPTGEITRIQSPFISDDDLVQKLSQYRKKHGGKRHV